MKKKNCPYMVHWRWDGFIHGCPFIAWGPPVLMIDYMCSSPTSVKRSCVTENDRFLFVMGMIISDKYCIIDWVVTLHQQKQILGFGKRREGKNKEEGEDEYTLDGSVDRHGSPAIRARSGGWQAGILLLGNLLKHPNSNKRERD